MKRKVHSLYLELNKRIFNEKIFGLKGYLSACILFCGFVITTLYVKFFANLNLTIIHKAYIFLYLYAKSFRDKGKIEYTLSFLNPGDHVVDVGAGLGFFTRKVAERVGSEGMVISIEPEQISYSLLCTNIKSFSDKSASCQTIHTAIGEKQGTANLYICESNIGESSLSELDVSDRYYEVDVETLDRLRKYWAPVKFLKIDTQGSEIRVLRGSLELIKKDHPIILVEYWPFGLEKNNFKPDELLEILYNLKYRVYRLDLSGFPEVCSNANLEDITVNSRCQCDLLAFPK